MEGIHNNYYRYAEETVITNTSEATREIGLVPLKDITRSLQHLVISAM
jgi:hypothetical protein